MIVPGKFLSFNESVVAKCIIVWEELIQIGNGTVRIHDLFEKLDSKLKGIDEFIYALDLLYLLDMIDFDKVAGTVRHVNRD